MKKVFSLALYRHPKSEYEQPEAGAGRGVFFAGFLPAIVRAYRSVFPDWELRIHHDERAPGWPYFRVLAKLAARDLIRLVPMGNAETLCGAMLWRMLPIWDPSVQIVVCRDVDSLPTPRERLAINAWLASTKPIHAIHDSPSHSSARFLGGLVGFDAGWVRGHVEDMSDFLFRASRIDMDKKGADQLALDAVFGEWWPQDVLTDTRATMPVASDPRDECDGFARHLGGAFFAGPVARFYDEHYRDETLIEIEKEILG